MPVRHIAIELESVFRMSPRANVQKNKFAQDDLW